MFNFRGDKMMELYMGLEGRESKYWLNKTNNANTLKKT